MFIVLLATLFVCSSVAQSPDALRNAMSEFSFWRNSTVGYPELFMIDKENQLIVLAVKNSLCHISLDLSEAIDIKNTTPLPSAIHKCMNDQSILQSQESCQNFHHIAVFPASNDTIVVNNNTIDVKDTILICGSNAFQPKCIYRNRTSLDVIQIHNGEQFCPHGEESSNKAIVTKDGFLVSGSSQDIFSSKFGISVSLDPFNGTASIRTIDDSNMFKKPVFIDLYDIGDFYYIFMREPAVEVTDDVIYSRVGRMCKNDTGILIFENSNSQNVFTSFLKARMSCTSDIYSDGPTYYYDNLKDTEFIESGTVNTLVMGKHLYAAFSAPANGPDGSVLCVYTFGGGDSDLDGIFKQKYLEQTGPSEWVEVSNSNPVTCSNTRDLSVANKHYLMKPTAVQAGTPLIKLDGLLFQQIIIDTIEGINGNIYEVILVAANEEDLLKVLKMSYVYTRDDEEKTHISQEITITSDSNNYETIMSMELYKTVDEATVYVSTNEGIYRVPISDCAKYTNCRSCIESRDPYCAYDTSLSTCVNTLTGYTVDYIQDIDNGDYSNCPVTPSSTVVTPPLTTNAFSTASSSSSLATMDIMTSTADCTMIVDVSYTTTTTTETILVQASVSNVQSRITSTANDNTRPSSRSALSTNTFTSTLTPDSSQEPTSRGLEDKQDNNNLYMTIGIGGACFIAGIAFGIVVFACIRNKDKFIWGKMLSRNRRLNFDNDDEKCNNQYEMCNTKNDDFQKNNGYEYTKETTPRPSTPPLTKLNPTSQPGKVTDSPILSKYTTTAGKTHNRSMSSGGRFPMSFPIIDTPPHHSPVPESPVRKNIRNTFHIEEGVSNNERQKYGKNIVSKQLSREYPMSYSDGSPYFHAKTNSLDGWSSPR